MLPSETANPFFGVLGHRQDALLLTSLARFQAPKFRVRVHRLPVGCLICWDGDCSRIVRGIVREGIALR
jgi:hypothetical protein